MDTRNEQLFQHQAAMEQAYKRRIMGTPLPEFSDSDLDISVPNSQTPTTQPHWNFHRGFNFTSGFPPPGNLTPDLQFRASLGFPQASIPGFHPYMHAAMGNSAGSVPVGNFWGGTAGPSNLSMPLPSFPVASLPLPSIPVSSVPSPVPAPAPIRSPTLERPASTPVATETSDDPQASATNRTRTSSQPVRTTGRRKSTASTSREGGRMQWSNAQVVIFLECKKAQWIESESLTGRDQIITAEAKLKKLQSALASRGISASTTQIRWKWDSLLMKYKAIRLYDQRTGSSPFASLSRAEKKELSLPTDFEPEWLDMIEEFYGSNPTVERPCVADSSSPFAGLEVPQTPEEEADITEREEEDPNGRRTNSEDFTDDQDDMEMLLLIIGDFLILVEELLQHLQQSSARRVRPRLHLSPQNVLPDESNVIISIGLMFCMLTSMVKESPLWWVRQRSLVWFDRYLTNAYGADRWNDVLRMPKHIFNWLCVLLGPAIKKKDTRWRKAVPVNVRLGAVMSRLVTGHSYFFVSDRFGIRESMLAEMFQDTIDAINTILGPMFLRWPNPEELGAVADGFYRRCNLPNVHGAIDGTHIRVKTPRQADNPVPYYNRKKYHSLALQGVCDSDGVFTDVSVGLPGSANDQRMLAFSGLYDQVHRSQMKMTWPVCRINGGYRLRPYLLGDSGYAIQQWLMIPYLQSSNLSEMEALYNEHHVRGRLVIEQAFGHLKGKFKLLEHGINSSVTWAAKVAYSCCVLNNVLVKYRVGFWQKDVIPAYDRARATSLANVDNDHLTPSRLIDHTSCCFHH